MSTTTRERLEAAVADLEKFGDELDAKGVALCGEDLENLKNRMEEIKNLKDQVQAEAERAGTVADARSFLKELSGDATKEPKRESLTVSGMPMDPQGKTIGEMFVQSEQYKDFMGRYGSNGAIPNSVKGIQTASFNAGMKALVTGASDTSAGAFVTPDRYGMIDPIGERELYMRNLVTVSSTTSDSVEYVRITSKTSNAAPVAEATTAAGPTIVEDVITPATGGGYKPESALAFEKKTAAVVTLAHWIPITKRAAADAPQVRTMIDAFLRVGLNDELDDQMLTGSGSGENFEGILNVTGIGSVGSAGTDLDAIVDGIRTVRANRRRPTGLVIHPNDWYSEGFLLAKDDSGKYLVGDPRASVDQLSQLWGLRVVVSEGITENTALVGDFRQAVLWDREGVNIMVSDQHSDFFTRNLLAILGENRAAFGVLDATAFCKVTAI